MAALVLVTESFEAFLFLATFGAYSYSSSDSSSFKLKFLAGCFPLVAAGPVLGEFLGVDLADVFLPCGFLATGSSSDSRSSSDSETGFPLAGFLAATGATFGEVLAAVFFGFGFSTLDSDSSESCLVCLVTLAGALVFLTGFCGSLSLSD